MPFVWRWTAMSESNKELLEEVDDAIKVFLSWYRAWFFVYISLVVLTILLPGLAAMGIFTDLTNRLLAGAGALLVAVSSALKPHEYATAFDAGGQLAWKTGISLVAGTIDKETAAKELRRAIDLTTFKYGPAGAIRNPRQNSN